MDDFSAKPGVPNAYGLVGGDANAVGPVKRPLSSMSPTIVLKDGKPWLATGSPGGARIITTTLQVLVNMIDFGMNPAEAGSAVRFHDQWLPDELRIERGLSPDTIALLRGMGHNGGRAPGDGRHADHPDHAHRLLRLLGPARPERRGARVLSMHALVFHGFGGADVLRFEPVPDPVPGPAQALVRMRAIGVNFADVYRRKGNYHLAGTPPWILGYEGAGEVVAAPAGSGLQPGQRVGFADSPFANAELCAVDVDRLIPLPDDIAFDTAAASLLQGLTAQYLCRDSYAVRAGDWAVVHAAAGGVGLLLVQILRHLGARVVGIASTSHHGSGKCIHGHQPPAGMDRNAGPTSTGIMAGMLRNWWPAWAGIRRQGRTVA